MKKLLVLLLAIGLAMPVLPALAQEEDECGFCGGLSYARYRFNHFIQDIATGDTSEYFDDDFDTTFTFKTGEIEAFFELEVSDANAGGDKDPQSSYANAIGAYGARWMPDSMADSEFKLEVGDIGTGFGKNVNNDDSPWGSIEVSWKMGEASILLGYGKDYEGDTNDDVEGDINMFRGQFHMPLGESGFNMGAYAAAYMGSDVNTLVIGSVDATATQSDLSLFLGSVEFSGAVNSVDVYTEAGFTTGSFEPAGFEDVDLGAFYALGGVNFAMGQVSFGVEAGFGSGDDDAADDSIDDFISFNNDFGFDEIIEDEILDNGLSNKIYMKAKASVNPTEKLTLTGSFIYVKPTEEIMGVGGDVDTYGFEFDGEVDYQLSENLTYVLVGAFASLEEDWLAEDSAFQVMNRLQFMF